MAKDSKAVIAAALDEHTLHGLMAQQAEGLDKITKEMKALFAKYGCSDFNSAYNAFISNKEADEEFRVKRNALIEQLKTITATMDAIKDAQGE